MQNDTKENAGVFENERTQNPGRKPRKTSIARRIVFVAIVAIVCLCPLGYNCLNRIDNETFPIEPGLAGGTTTTNDTDLWTTSEIRADPIGALLCGAISDKLTVQVEPRIESSLENSFPCHDNLLLTNAALQRAGIKTATKLTFFEAYPTFFGSEYFEDEKLGILGKITVSESPADSANCIKFAEEINRLASSNPNIRFAYCQVYLAWQSWYSPTYELVSNPTSREFMVSHVIEKLDSRIIAVEDGFRSEEDYLTGWFSTDHHWTPERAMVSYALLAEKLCWQELEYAYETEVANSWYGSFSRFGLDLDFSSSMFDSNLKTDSIEWKNLSGRENPRGKKEDIQNETFSYANGSYGVYDSYFGSVDCEAWNSNPAQTGTCLVISNSMVRTLKDDITSNYEHTVFRGHSSLKDKLSLQKMIDEYNPDDIVFILSPEAVQTISQNIFSS